MSVTFTLPVVMPEPQAKQHSGSSVLSFDFGAARIGVAVGSRLTGSAQPLPGLNGRGGEGLWRELDKLLAEWQPATVVVGLPLGLDGSDTPMTGRAREFARELGIRTRAAVCLHDERLTSRAAASRFAEARSDKRSRRRDSRLLDSMAAALILESWLAEQASCGDVAK